MLGFVTGRLAQLMEDYAVPYSDAPVFYAGDIVACGKIDPEWPDWIPEDCLEKERARFFSPRPLNRQAH